MNDNSQIQRLIRILQILSSGRKITTKELQKRFNDSVSLRTLQRDFIALSEAGIPLRTEKNYANENAWSLMSQYRSFIPIPLETNEYLAAHILKANLKVFTKTPFEKEIQSLIEKIDQIVPDEIFLEPNIDKAENIFENYSAGNFDYSSFGETIDKIISAILNRNICEVTYFNPYDKKEKTYPIEPEKLVYYNGGLYIIAYISKYDRFRLLAVQRIIELEISDEKYPNDHNFKSERFWRSKFGLFSGEQVKVKLLFGSVVRHHIEGRLWHSSQELKVQNDGSITLTMSVGITPELISWILGWNKFVKVIKPTELIDEISNSVSEMADLYK